MTKPEAPPTLGETVTGLASDIQDLVRGEAFGVRLGYDLLRWLSIQGHLIGSIEGFRFTLARSEEGDPKGLRTAAGQVIAPEIRNRAERLAGAPNEELILATDGMLRWKGEIVAQLGSVLDG